MSIAIFYFDWSSRTSNIAICFTMPRSWSCARLLVFRTWHCAGCPFFPFEPNLNMMFKQKHSSWHTWAGICGALFRFYERFIQHIADFSFGVAKSGSLALSDRMPVCACSRARTPLVPRRYSGTIGKKAHICLFAVTHAAVHNHICSIENVEALSIPLRV